MDENPELKFKALMDIWAASLRLLGAANATGALAAGAAYQAFDKKPDIQLPMKILVVVFLLGVISFALSQIAMFLTQYSMELYFMRLREPSEWERAFWNTEMLHQERNHLVGAKWAYYLMFFLGMVSLSCFMLGLVSVTIYANNL
jgi:hypothetical protein